MLFNLFDNVLPFKINQVIKIYIVSVCDAAVYAVNANVCVAARIKNENAGYLPTYTYL